MKKLWTSRYWKAFQDGHNEGVCNGIDVAHYLLLIELRRIGSTGDNFEAKWSDIEALFPAEIVEKTKQTNVYF